MIPLVDDYLQLFIAEKLRFLKDNPTIIDHIFHTGKRETLSKLKDFIENRKIKVVIGYPKDQNSLPCYVITLAPEQEQPIGLGDDGGYYEDLGIDENDEILEQVEKEMSQFLAATYMNSNYRIECWSDNGDLTSYMYVILKWCLWSSRQAMLNMGWVNIKVNGTDLEPVPDYMPVFIYRRAAQVNLMYENLYYEDIAGLESYLDIIENPDNYSKDEEGNIIDENGEVILPAQYTWILRAHYCEATIGDTTKNDSEITTSKEVIIKKVEVDTSICDELPAVGKTNVRYLVANRDEDGEVAFYTEYTYVNGEYKVIGASNNADYSKYATLETVEKKDKAVLQKANTYTDTSTDEVRTSDVGATAVNDLFNNIFNK